MIKFKAFIAASLDGFIARENGSIDWLEKFNSTAPKGEDCGYKSFINGIDAIVMGRNTFETVKKFSEWPYTLHVYVLSSAPLESSPFYTKVENIPSLIEILKKKNVSNCYVDGGKTIQSFISSKLLSEITITTIGVLIGSGNSLFGPLNFDVQVKNTHTIAYDFGCTQTRYEFKY